MTATPRLRPPRRRRLLLPELIPIPEAEVIAQAAAVAASPVLWTKRSPQPAMMACWRRTSTPPSEPLLLRRHARTVHQPRRGGAGARESGWTRVHRTGVTAPTRRCRTSPLAPRSARWPLAVVPAVAIAVAMLVVVDSRRRRLLSIHRCRAQRRHPRLRLRRRSHHRASRGTLARRPRRRPARPCSSPRPHWEVPSPTPPNA
mmetsp:Transcript_30096/g.75765  ORF Transcript_30096/g.75765 Transcript_30096/m.75765 type:complete len:202 (+) Transcript_30096:379-984(+)